MACVALMLCVNDSIHSFNNEYLSIGDTIVETCSGMRCSSLRA